MKTFRLYLGRDIASAQTCVSEAEFQEFLQTSVDTRLDGYTILSGARLLARDGRVVLGDRGVLRDESIVLAIAADYALRFRQNSILVLESYGHARLVFRLDEAVVEDVRFAVAGDLFRPREGFGARVE